MAKLLQLALFYALMAAAVGFVRYRVTNTQRTVLHDTEGIWTTPSNNSIKYTVLTRAEDTDGQNYTVEIYNTAGAYGFYWDKPCSPPMHLHKVQNETFKVKSGVFSYEVNGEQGTKVAGDEITIPAGTPHTFWNAGKEDLVVDITLSPAGPSDKLTEKFFENFAAVSWASGGLENVNPLQMVLMFSYFEMITTDIPLPLWTMAEYIVVPIAKMFGFQPFYPEYRTLKRTAAAPAVVQDVTKPAESGEAQCTSDTSDGQCSAPTAELIGHIEPEITPAAAETEEL